MEDDMDMDMEDEGPIKVVKNYKRQVRRAPWIKQRLCLEGCCFCVSCCALRGMLCQVCCVMSDVGRMPGTCRAVTDMYAVGTCCCCSCGIWTSMFWSVAQTFTELLYVSCVITASLLCHQICSMLVHHEHAWLASFFLFVGETSLLTMQSALDMLFLCCLT